jgi:hypothetical protein
MKICFIVFPVERAVLGGEFQNCSFLSCNTVWEDGRRSVKFSLA